MPKSWGPAASRRPPPHPSASVWHHLPHSERHGPPLVLARLPVLARITALGFAVIRFPEVVPLARIRLAPVVLAGVRLAEVVLAQVGATRAPVLVPGAELERVGLRAGLLLVPSHLS